MDQENVHIVNILLDYWERVFVAMEIELKSGL
jgi:hypothetical protein